MKTAWEILPIISLVLLIFYWKSRNAVWGGLTIGIVVGLIWKFIGGTEWNILIKTGTVGVLVGFGAELLNYVSNYLKKKLG